MRARSIAKDSQGLEIFDRAELSAVSFQRSAFLGARHAHMLHFAGSLGQFAVVLGVNQLDLPRQQQVVVQLAG